MDRATSKEIIYIYFKAWINIDEDSFLSVLDEDVIINECTGDTYLNRQVAKNWFRGWHEEGNRVLSWEINECYFDEMEEMASAKWRFICLYQGKDYTFDGVTMIRFKGDKIICLDEYQMEVDKKYPYSK